MEVENGDMEAEHWQRLVGTGNAQISTKGQNKQVGPWTFNGGFLA